MLTSFVPVPAGHPFPIQNLPFGVFRPAGGASPRVGVALGDYVVDLSVVADAGLLADCGYLDGAQCFHKGSLNEFMAMGRGAWQETRRQLQTILHSDEAVLRDNTILRSHAILHKSHVNMEMPAQIGDYTDFYSSREHATNVGALFRSRENALNPNWLHLPVGYHGRASSIVVSGTDVRRPVGQLGPAADATPLFGPSRQLDYELEVHMQVQAFLVGPGSDIGDTISVDEARDHIFGLVLCNDWSARDIQRWEYVPLGPFLSKSFATSISPWVVTLEALEPFRCPAPVQNPHPLPYLRESDRHTFSIDLEVQVQLSEATATTPISQCNFSSLYWTMPQQLAHHTVAGCNVRTGDMMASGTISGPVGPRSAGCLLEATKGGKEPIPICLDSLAEHAVTHRTFLEDGDEVVLTGMCKAENVHSDSIAAEVLSIGFGECRGRVLPAKTMV